VYYINWKKYKISKYRKCCDNVNISTQIYNVMVMCVHVIPKKRYNVFFF